MAMNSLGVTQSKPVVPRLQHVAALRAEKLQVTGISILIKSGCNRWYNVRKRGKHASLETCKL